MSDKKSRPAKADEEFLKAAKDAVKNEAAKKKSKYEDHPKFAKFK